MKGLSLARNELIWIAETDDSVDRRFLSNILPAFTREDVMAAFGRISCIDQDGAARNDLDHYFDDLENFSWNYSCVVPSHRAFSHDFSVKNVIPNASGLVFRKPVLTDGERNRLFEYRFAGDWYFYALVARGGSIAYCRRARSFFRVNQSSASRSSFFTERHLTEHKMVIRDLRREYGIGDEAINAHCEALAPYMQDYSSDALKEAFRQHLSDNADLPPIRICIAANGFAVGGGEILPVELANTLKGMGVHVTYLVIERPVELRDGQIRKRLRPDIPVVYWDAISDDFAGFIKNFGIQLINSHNVSVDFRVFLGNIDLKIPYVVSLHGGYETVPDLLTPDFLDYLSKNVKKWLYLAKRNFAFLPSEACDPQKLLYSFNALPAYQGEWVNRDEFRSQHHIAADAFVFVLCSRAIEAKGWRTAIAIAKTLSERKEPPVHLVLIGDGPIAAELRAEYEVAPFVTFLGQVNSPVRYFKCFDMGIFPTQFEGETFPLFLLECFQVGLPAITTDIGEIPRMMEATAGHAPGILVDHRSKPKKLGVDFVTKLQKMFDSPNTYANYRVGALATSERFSIEGLGELYRNAFQDLLLGQTDTMATKQPAARSEARL
jgi:glycosyltransferase involved in cell wall biosynthesis